MQIDNRFTKIDTAEFAAIYAAADDRSEKDYRSVRGPLIQFAWHGGRVTHMNYVGGAEAGSFRRNR